MMKYENPEAQEVSEILDAVSSKVPEMITNILKTVYSAEAGRNVGQAVGNLFRELVDAGIPHEMAVKMASDYMISFKDLLGTVNPAVKSMSTKESTPSDDE